MDNHSRIIESLIVNEYKAGLRYKLDYWRNHSDPEGLYHCGTNKTDQIRLASEEIEQAKNITFQEIKDLPLIYDFCMCLRAGMRTLYLQAEDFNLNPFIKMGNLRKVVIMREMLNRADGFYECYSTKYLISVN